MTRTTATSAALLLTLAVGIGAAPALAQAPAGRPTVSVPEFKNTVNQSWWWSGPVAEDLSAALANELQAGGGVQVVERSNLKAVLSEQELAELGIVRQGPAAAQRGQMTGARYIVLGTVSSYESNVATKTSGSGMSLLGIGGRSEQAETTDYVAIDIRVVDSTTGEVVGFRTVEGTATSTAESRQQGVNLLPAAGLTILGVPMSRGGQALVGAAGTFRYDNSSSETQRTPVGKAIRAALVDASDYVNCLLAPQGDCMQRFEAQDQRRRQRTRGVLQLD
ncbi:CsgG/HfaB family protein [Cyanobium sp. CH-040]|uniref:CsgG/HfaB family protein n=1 Tax=Cyanobium sp. CH-040 TaxID=2823708 RepID=UPI0020CFCD90|nr:CsgG/HfaB family protein [Cyanobium sp. CH-040]MCP9928385.1 penicillin-binding protein activator LpoB [Cyanobium sp. CH-040]